MHWNLVAGRNTARVAEVKLVERPQPQLIEATVSQEPGIRLGRSAEEHGRVPFYLI